MRRLLVVLCLLLLPASPSGAAQTWAYVTASHSGVVYVVDVSADRLVRAIPVEDRDGMIGLAVTTDGRRVFIVDGNGRSRLRVLDALSGHVLDDVAFQNRRLRPAGLPVATLSSDDRWLFVQAQGATRVFDVRAGRFRARGLAMKGCKEPHVLGGGPILYALCRRAFHAVVSVGGFVEKARAAVGFASPAAALAMRDGSRAFALASVPPMRALPAPRPTPSPRPGTPAPSPSPTPNPALREGPWLLASWQPAQARARRIDLVKRVDLEKVSASGLPALAVSPDNRWLAVVYGRRAWILHPDRLAVQWEIFPPGTVNGAAFTADSEALLTVLDGSLLSIRLSNRSYRLVVEGQIRTARPPLVTTAPRPTGSQARK